MQVQLRAMRSLSHLCARPEVRAVVVGGGGVKRLVDLGKKPELRDAAALVLASISVAPHTEAIAKGGGVEVLIDTLSQGGGELTAHAAAALAQLVSGDAGRKAILLQPAAKDGGVTACVELLLRNKKEAVLLSALGTPHAFGLDQSNPPSTSRADRLRGLLCSGICPICDSQIPCLVPEQPSCGGSPTRRTDRLQSAPPTPRTPSCASRPTAARATRPRRRARARAT